MNVSITLQIDEVCYTPKANGNLVSTERRCKIGDVRAIGGELYHCSGVYASLWSGLFWKDPDRVEWTPVRPDAQRQVHDAVRAEANRITQS